MKLGLLCAALLASVSMTQAATLVYSASLSGPNEFPANASPGTGTALVTLDDVANTVSINVTFTGLQGTVTAAHIHGPTAVAGTGTAGVALGFTGFPTGVTSGVYNSGTVAIPSTNLAAIVAAGNAGTSYVNIHSSSFGGGEIRGFLSPAAVPEPSAAGLAGLTLLGLVSGKRRRK